MFHDRLEKEGTRRGTLLALKGVQNSMFSVAQSERKENQGKDRRVNFPVS